MATENRMETRFSTDETGHNWSQCSFCIFLLPLPTDWVFDGSIPKKICAAFPDGIPDDIRANRVLHDKPVEGDHGITWKPVPENLGKVFEFQPMRYP